MPRLAAKRLSAVEVSADASHQHEFNATALKNMLEFPDGRTSGRLAIFYYSDASDDPEEENSTYTLYDSRENRPRSAEYRLYFASPELQERAGVGDILVLGRPTDGTDLRAVIVPGNSPFGRALDEALAEGGVELSSRFREIAGQVGHESAATLLSVGGATAIVDPDDFLAVTDEAFVRAAIDGERMPDTRAMAAEAGKVVSRLRRDRTNPDFDLQWSLDAETVLFQHIEGKRGQCWLDAQAAKGALAMDATIEFAMSYLQARKARRGHSLQHHFGRILTEHHIAHTPQCETENGETPDFMFPGCREYADPGFPAERLRMVACKSVVRDRWRQPLNEAKRITEKYLLTIDPQLTEATIGNMLAARLLVFMPRPLIVTAYRESAAAPKLSDVANLLERLRAAEPH